MKKLLLMLASVLFFYGTAQTTTVNYTSSTEVFSNPERGFFKFTEAHSNDYELISQSSLTNYRTSQNITLIYRGFYLENFMNSPITQSYLNNMQTDFNRIRNAGLKVIVRFAYTDDEETLIDKCDEGDIIGLRPFFAKDNYLMTAKAREESLLYAIPIEVFKPYVSQNIEVLNFLLESFASNTRNPYDKENKGKLISENVIYNEQSSEIQYYQPIKYTKEPITAKRKDTVKKLAELMTLHKIGSVIIQEKELPIGIITDKDLRSKIATGIFPIDVAVENIMASPVITVQENISIAETQLMMLKNNVGHLCVTLDGTNKSKIVGIISEHDVVVAQANNPGVLLKQTKKASRSKDLMQIREKLKDLIQNSLDKNIPFRQVFYILNRCYLYSLHLN